MCRSRGRCAFTLIIKCESVELEKTSAHARMAGFLLDFLHKMWEREVCGEMSGRAHPHLLRPVDILQILLEGGGGGNRAIACAHTYVTYIHACKNVGERKRDLLRTP